MLAESRAGGVHMAVSPDQFRMIYFQGQPSIGLLEEELEAMLDNTWGDTAKALVNNWLGLVYQVTNLDRKEQFMEEIDPGDPLGVKTPRKQPD